MTEVVIVGGGFAGIKAARFLSHDARFAVTLISDRADFEYHAGLYRSATGRSKLEVSIPLSEILSDCPNVTLVTDTVRHLDKDSHTITSASGSVYGYDKLLLGLGMVTSFFGITGLDRHAYGIKSFAEAQRLKDHLHHELTLGHEPDQNYVVVGAGPTGVELAGELVEYLRRLRSNHKRAHGFAVHLVEASTRVLPSMPEDVSLAVAKRLESLGVTLHLATAVSGETPTRLQLPDGEYIQSHAVIWTAGVTNNGFFSDNAAQFKLGHGKRVIVGPDLSAGTDVYVMGDSAETTQSGWAQTAIYDADFVTSNLKRTLDGQSLLAYSPPKPVAAVPVGPSWCAVSRGRIKVYGLAGWHIRRQLDRRLFKSLLPPKLARRAWNAGSVRSESCRVCTGEFA